MRVGVVGAGKMGRNHLRVYSEMRGVDDIFMYDVDYSSVPFMRGVTACDSLDELLDKADAISICTPTPMHLGVAFKAFEVGVSTLIEKPMCATIEQGEKLLDAIPNGIVVGVGHIERFNPAVVEAKKIMKDPLYVEIKRHNPVSARSKGTSVIEALMIHDIDIAMNLLLCDDLKLSDAAGDMDVCAALFKYKDTAPVYISSSRMAAKKVRNLYIEEEDLTIDADMMAQEVSIYRKPKSQITDGKYIQENLIERVLVNKVEPLREELSTFLNCVKYQKMFPITPPEALNNIKMCEAIKDKIKYSGVTINRGYG